MGLGNRKEWNLVASVVPQGPLPAHVQPGSKAIEAVFRFGWWRWTACCACRPVPKLKAAFIRRSGRPRHNVQEPWKPNTMKPSIYALIAVLALLTLPPAALADRAHDHDRARAALRAGEVLPLTTILERVAQQQPGQVMEVDLEREDGRWIYELKLLNNDGALVKLQVDARDGVVLKRKNGKP